MTESQLAKKVKYWQKILKLEHWDITCELVHDGEIDGRIGQSFPQLDYLTSHIKIMDPQFDQKREVNIDESIIHELLHCHTGPLGKADKKSAAREEELLVTYLQKAIYDLWAGEEA